MDKKAGAYKISRIRRRYIVCQLMADVFFALALTVSIYTILSVAFECSPWWAVLFFAISLFALVLSHKYLSISDLSVSGFLNGEYPELEESSSLVLKPDEDLNLLESFQQQKVANVLQALPNIHRSFFKRLKLALLLFIVTVGLSLFAGRYVGNGHATYNGQSTTSSKEEKPEKILPQISAVEVEITPPAYTGKPQTSQEKFTLNVADGAVVSWKIATNIAVKRIALIFNDRETISLKAANQDRTEWKTSKAINKPGFYQVNVDGKLSELYQVQVITDQPPVIRIKAPKQYTYIDAGEAQKININASVNDDYGVSNAQLLATVAKGSGEGVKFKEYKLDFGASFATHNSQYNLQKLINLPSLNMEPGDELYFYIEAADTHGQHSRTDVFTVSIQDTAQLLSMDGMLTGVNQKPEFFRSERQIILDTEHLLKDKDTISTEKFNNRSNDLGVDQKLLRLRYGKFLGEESESDINPADEKNDPVGDIANYGNAGVILDKYTDKHDNAEDAQFFDPEIKKQLKATLTEMWKAELQLRLNKPQDALPFEYKALRLLKDLQQKSRAYVAKTAYNPPPIKPEKRLSGDLSKIGSPLNRENIKPATDQFDNLKKATAILEQLKSSPRLSDADVRILNAAGQQLSVKASAEPGAYLPALSAMRRILSADKTKRPADIALVERAIQKTLSDVSRVPAAGATGTDLGLSQQYYKNLNRQNR